MKQLTDDARTPGQHGSKSQKSKYRQYSGHAQLSKRSWNNETPPNEDEPAGGTSDKNTGRDGKRFEKSKFRAEKSGAKLDTAHKKLATQKEHKKPGPVKTVGRAARFQAHYFVHSKINEAEHENVGLEAAHKTELTGERAVEGGARFVRHRIRTHPARRVNKWEQRDIKAKSDMQNREMAREHPELKKNTISRFLHKRRLKKRYQKQARTLAKQGGKATQKTAVTTEKIACTVVGFIRRHPVGLLVFIGVFLLLVSMHSCMASMRMMKYEVHQKPIRANDAGSTPALPGYCAQTAARFPLPKLRLLERHGLSRRLLPGFAYLTEEGSQHIRS